MKNQSLQLVFMLCLLASLCNAQLPSYLPTNGLVAWYPFNGNANDESGNGNNGVVNGATLTLDRFGTQDFAYSFDGLNDNIIISADSSITGFYNFSISLWFNPNSFPGDDLTAIISKWAFPTDCGYQGEDYGIWLTPDGRTIGGSKVNTQSNIMPSFQSSIGQWQQVVFVHDAINGSRIYKDGILSETSSLNGSLCYLFNNLIFGSGEVLPFAGTRQYNGALDDIAIFNRALTSAEVSALHTAEQTDTGGGGGSIANSPPGIPYQAEVRNESGEVLANANVNIRFTLHEQAANGTVSYQETHALATNELGLFTATIGAGTAVQGTFASINWAQTTKFLQVEVDTGSGWITMGNQQLMSVPYAMYAANGPVGPQGPAGADGQPGPQGEPGANGLSAYEMWLAEGYSGSVSDFLNSQPNNSSTAHGSFQATGLGVFVVPNNVKNIELSMSGSIGGNGGTAIGLGFYQFAGGTGGISGFTRVIIPVNPGDSIMYQIGNNGVNGGNCLATGSCGSSPGCACVGGSGIPGENSTLKLNGVNLFQISGGTGGTGGSYGLPNAPGNGGSQGIVTYSSESISSGIIPLATNVWNIEQRSILIRY